MSELVVALTLVLAGTPAEAGAAAGGDDDKQAPIAASAPAYEEPGFEVVALPLYLQSPDAGPTFQGAASFFLHDGETRPYKLFLGGTASTSIGGVLSALAFFEWVRPFGAPLRLLASAGYQSTLAGHYCGRGPAVTCAEREAELAAAERSLRGEDRDTFLRRYYRTRYHGPLATAQLRWMVKDLPHKVEAVLSARGYRYFPGSVGFSGLRAGPYPGSRYAEDFPEGEPGLLHVVEGGVMMDNRDQEAGPTRGYWVEASIRSASALTLSDWSFGGANLTARGYLPLRQDGSLVVAERVILDALVGDAPTYELQRVGGTWALTAFGGRDVGRGLREGRVMGKLKSISQTELQARLLRAELFGVPFALGLVGFVDVALVSGEALRASAEDFSLNWGFGAGLRLRVMQNLLFRFELAVSPAEAFQPQIYAWPAWTF